jgi:hypothetical protein
MNSIHNHKATPDNLCHHYNDYGEQSEILTKNLVLLVPSSIAPTSGPYFPVVTGIVSATESFTMSQ